MKITMFKIYLLMLLFASFSLTFQILTNDVSKLVIINFVLVIYFTSSTALNKFYGNDK